MSFVYKYWLYAVVIFSLIAFNFLVLPPGKSIAKYQIWQMQSDNQLKCIARGILEYRLKNGGKLPVKMSDLVSDDDFDSLKMFYAPNQSKNPINRLNWKNNLDKYTDYVLPSNSSSGILVRERSGIWPDGSVAVCYDTLTVKRLNPAEFAELKIEGK